MLGLKNSEEFSTVSSKKHFQSIAVDVFQGGDEVGGGGSDGGDEVGSDGGEADGDGGGEVSGGGAVGGEAGNGGDEVGGGGGDGGGEVDGDGDDGSGDGGMKWVVIEGEVAGGPGCHI